jgi:sugar phosphate isomerase/epimerase
MNTFKLGVVLESLGLPFRAALPEAAKLGVQGVQLDAAGDLTPDRLGDTGRREVRTLLRSFNLELAAVNCPLRRGLDVFEDQQPRLDHIRKAMQLAFDLGAKKVVVPLPAIPTDEPKPDDEPPKPFSFLTMAAAPPKAVTLRESLLALAAAGDKIGTRVCLEGGLDPGPAVRDYLNTFTTGSLGVTFDPANFVANGHDPVANVMALNDLVWHTHARDVRAGTTAGGPQEVAVGAGDVEWMAYTAALSAIEYRGFVCAERTGGPNQFVDITNGVKFLRRFIPAPTG